MATQDGAARVGAGAPPTVGLALSGSNSSAYVLRWALAKFAKDDDDGTPAAAFKLIHVPTPVLAVPTPPPVGNYLPIDQVCPEIAEDYVQKVWVNAQKMLAGCKETCDQNKVDAQVVLVNGNDVADTISNLVAQHQIQILVVGASRGSFNRTSSKICKGVPSFCTAYVVSKDGSSSVYAPGSKIDVTSGSGVPKGNSSSSNTEVFSEDSSLVSDLNGNSSARVLSGFPSLPCSNLASGNLQSTASSESRVSFTLYDYLTGKATVYNDNDRIAESSIASKLRGSDKVPTQDNSLRQLMLSDNKDSVKTVQFDLDTELEMLRLELRDIRGAYKLESVDASHQVVESAARGMEGEGQLREIQSRVDKANNDTQEEMEHRLLAQTSKDADKKPRLEQRSVLQGNSYLTFTWEEIDSATSSFSESRKIGTGSNGTVYRGHLNDLEVAIKVLHSNDKTSTKHFNKELEVLSRTRHPHLLMLLGACPDRGCLVYEYMENGSLADRLQRINDTPPIAWFHRFRIAQEIVSALLFLHSTKPNPIIHRDLKPKNVLLDANLVSKIGDVGLSTLVPLKDTLSSLTVYKKTGVAGTLFYLDPEYQRTGQVSVKSDTYSFRMVILQLLTARPP